MTEMLKTPRTDINFAFNSFIEAHRFIVKHRMFKYILAIGFFFMLLFIAYLSGAWGLMELGFDRIENWDTLRRYKENYSWLKWPIMILQYTLQVIVILLLTFIYKYIVLIVGSPLFAYLSEKTEEIANGTQVPFSLKQLISDVGRGVRLALRNLVKQTGYTGIFTLASFLPIVGFLAPWFIARQDWYYYGFSMLDYSCERHKMGAKESVQFMKRHHVLATINGLVFYALMLIPILGAFIAPCYCSISATLAFIKIKENEEQ